MLQSRSRNGVQRRFASTEVALRPMVSMGSPPPVTTTAQSSESQTTRCFSPQTAHALGRLYPTPHQHWDRAFLIRFALENSAQWAMRSSPPSPHPKRLALRSGSMWFSPTALSGPRMSTSHSFGISDGMICAFSAATAAKSSKSPKETVPRSSRRWWFLQTAPSPRADGDPPATRSSCSSNPRTVHLGVFAARSLSMVPPTPKRARMRTTLRSFPTARSGLCSESMAATGGPITTTSLTCKSEAKTTGTLGQSPPLCLPTFSRRAR
mmetsp:Transcript_34019/g.79640  ORF Transcript_34019/g.79640 Transcript_34019/m.79640 type:complete len:266 (-) Transcript_34019:470-1267(-)